MILCATCLLCWLCVFGVWIFVCFFTVHCVYLICVALLGFVVCVVWCFVFVGFSVMCVTYFVISDELSIGV